MSLTAQLRQDIDDISNYLFGGGYPDPVSNTEQLAFLFFFYLAELYTIYLGMEKYGSLTHSLNCLAGKFL